ncbi:MAG: response regulator transcription factor [Verrucomicrobiota bacterium]
MSRAIRVLLVDDHQIVRMGLRTVFSLEPDLEVIGEASFADEAVEVYTKLLPDVTLMDLRMPGGGMNALRRIRELNPEAKVLVLSTSEREEDMHLAVESGAVGYALKSIPPEELAEAIRVVFGGGTWVPAEVARKLAQRQASPDLSPREMEVLQLLVKGLTNPEIGAVLAISRSTIKVHVTHILEKLGVADRTEAAAEAFRRGLLSE